MALPYFAVLLFSIFSGLYFIYSGDRLNPTDNTRGNIAGLIAPCQRAAVAYATENPTVGAAALANFTCTHASLNTNLALNLNVPNLRIAIEPASDSVAAATGRTITTYLPVNTALNYTPFAEVVTEVGTLYSNDVTVGVVQSDNTIGNSGGVVVHVPPAIAVGSLVMVTAVQ